MSKQMLELAVGQFTGFHYFHKNGNRVIGLVESMGLTRKEWEQIRSEVQWLDDNILTEIDEHFDCTGYRTAPEVCECGVPFYWHGSLTSCVLPQLKTRKPSACPRCGATRRDGEMVICCM